MIHSNACWLFLTPVHTVVTHKRAPTHKRVFVLRVDDAFPAAA